MSTYPHAFSYCIMINVSVGGLEQRSCARHVLVYGEMVPHFQYEAGKIINLLPKTFKSHDFYTLYTMGYPLSYLDLMADYHTVRSAHNQISKELARLSQNNLIHIRPMGDVIGKSMFDFPDKIKQWERTDI